ncbi:MAG: M50 family metallopeptidase [Candidatus Hydrogenedentes bacterium]|nr:M50 family metallopeptidase [Candidatus Hydrogenedentota bacterium]
MSSCLYAVLDIKSDILSRPTMRSDAYRLAELTRLPVVFWGVLWFVAAIGLGGYFLLTACRARTASDTADAP